MRPLLIAALLGAAATAPALPAPSASELWPLVDAYDGEALASVGPSALPVLVEMYRAADPAGKARVAAIFYQLGWESEAARQALMEDVRTDDQTLRIRVQYALGRVSNDDSVVDTLLAAMVEDPDPLLRDKAACGLAYDQIHLTESQKLRLFERLLQLLESPQEETRRLASTILYVHTGQWKQFRSAAPLAARQASVDRWRAWLEEYRREVQ